MAGCEQCKQSYLDSYDVVVDVLKEQNPTVEAHDIRVLAAQKFRPIHREMKRSTAVENSGDLKYENGEFIVTDEGKMFYPSTGQYAEDFHLNQLRLSKIRRDPSKYSLSDHQTTLLVQAAISEGAKVVRTSYPRDSEDNRDIFEFRIDPETRRGKIVVNNTAQDGNFHNLQEIKRIVQDNADNLAEVSPSEKVFILSDVKMDQDKALSIVQSVAQDLEQRPDKELAHRQQRLHIEKGNRQRITDNYTQNREARDNLRFKQETFDLPRGIREDISHHHQEVRGTVNALYIIAERNVGMGAVPVLLSSLTTELPKSVKAVEKSIVRHAQKETKTKKRTDFRKREEQKVVIGEELRKIHLGEIKSPVILLEIPENRKKRRKEIPPSKRYKVGLRSESRVKGYVEGTKRRLVEKKTQKIPLLERVAPALPIKQLEASQVLQKEKKLKRKQRRLTVMLLRLARRINAREKRINKTVELSRKSQFQKGLHIETMRSTDASPRVIRTVEQKRKSEKKKETILKLSFVLTLLWLLQEQQEVKFGQKKMLEKIEPHEPTPWVLLSIIWYLTMIRESGQAQSVKQNPKHNYRKRKLKKLYPQRAFPTQGVIFINNFWVH